MRVLITGANGQLGIALRRFAPPDVDVVALGRDELDITDRAAVDVALGTGADALINAAAYTNVEAAESAPAEAFRINSEGAATLARACSHYGIRLVHVSTDFVFDGTKEAPYVVGDEPRPLNVYGASKLEGERRVLAALADACVVRTSWVHGPDTANFVTKILQKAQLQTGHMGAALRVVADEVGSPTSVRTLASALWRCAVQSTPGLHHWSDAGSTTRFEYARAIVALAHEYALISELPRIAPGRVADFPSCVKRPAYSVLAIDETQAALGLEATPWRDALKFTMQDIRDRHNGAPQ